MNMVLGGLWHFHCEHVGAQRKTSMTKDFACYVTLHQMSWSSWLAVVVLRIRGMSYIEPGEIGVALGVGACC